MKQLLLIFICVLFVFNAKSEMVYYDSIPVGIGSDGGMFLRIDTSSAFPIYLPQSHYSNDTIPVIMLVSDTSEISLKMLGRGFSQMNNVVWQQRGYTIGSVYYTTIYLDENKQPLDKNIIVWMSMPTESTNRKYIGL